MAIARGVGSAIVGILGIVILVVAVVLIASVLRGDAPVEDLMLKTIDLRNAKSTVEKAQLISEVDDLVLESNNEEIREQWERMLGCLKTSCPDEAFLDLVLVTVSAHEKDVEYSAVLLNVIATAKYWKNDEHMLDFSKALSMANEQINALGDRNARKKWDAVIDCNGTCDALYDNYFELIKTLVQ